MILPADDDVKFELVLSDQNEMNQVLERNSIKPYYKSMVEMACRYCAVLAAPVVLSPIEEMDTTQTRNMQKNVFFVI